MRAFIASANAIFFLALGVFGQEPIGIFENHMDINDPTPPGDASYDAQTGEYQVIGGGKYLSDDIHFVYSEVTGDFRIRAKIRAEDQGGSAQEWATAGIEMRDSLERWTPEGLKRTMCWAWVTINDMAVVRWDFADGTYRVAPGVPPGLSPDVHDYRLEVVREGSSFAVYYFDRVTGGPIPYDSETLELPETVYVGLFATSFQAGGTTVGYFTDVELITEEPSAVEDWALYK